MTCIKSGLNLTPHAVSRWHACAGVQAWPLWPYALVFAAAVGVTLLWWSLLPADFRGNESSDYREFYAPVAQRWLNGQGWTEPNGATALRYLPGYPLVLAGVFALSQALQVPETYGLAAVTLIGMGLTAVFILALGRSFWPLWPAMGVVGVWLTYPCVLWLTKQPNSEIPFCVFFYGGLTCLLPALLHGRGTWKHYGLAGFCFGLAMLLRPIALGFSLVAGLMVLVAYRGQTHWRRYGLMALVIAGSWIAVLPWESWVYWHTGQVIPLSDNGPASIFDGLVFTASDVVVRPGAMPPDVQRLTQSLHRFETHETPLRGVGRSLQQALVTQPWTVVKLVGLKLGRSWYATDSTRYELPILYLQLFYLIAVLWGGWCAWRRGGVMRRLVACVGFAVLYFWGMTTLVLSIVRYMTPVMGLCFLLLPAAWPAWSGAASEDCEKA